MCSNAITISITALCAVAHNAQKNKKAQFDEVALIVFQTKINVKKVKKKNQITQTNKYLICNCTNFHCVAYSMHIKWI